MGKLLFLGTFGTDDPTRASMPFILASGALARGHEPLIVLMGEAVYLIKEGLAETVHGIGFPTLNEPLGKLIEHEVPIYLWGPCSVARGVTEADLMGKHASFVGPDDLADLMMEADRVLSF